MTRLLLLLSCLAAFLFAQSIEFTCPMDPDVRSAAPGRCPRCGMPLEARIPDFVQYPLEVTTDPPSLPAATPVEFRFRVTDPKKAATVTDFQIVHERLFHLFVVSRDLSYFSHEHPQLGPDGIFRLRSQLPKAGVYKLVGDYYPTHGTPQLNGKIVTTAGFRASIAESTPRLAPDLAMKTCDNLKVALRLEPSEPIAGKKTLLFFHLDPSDGLEQYLGAWAHMFFVSDDFVDNLHDHPTFALGGPDLQFDVFFPRPATYRVWVQFQRKGIVNTAAFTIPVRELK